MRADALHRWADGLWTLEGEPIDYLGVPYAIRMTIVRLDDGSLCRVDLRPWI